MNPIFLFLFQDFRKIMIESIQFQINTPSKLTLWIAIYVGNTPYNLTHTMLDGVHFLENLITCVSYITI